jgi:hypothetical protein
MYVKGKKGLSQEQPFEKGGTISQNGPVKFRALSKHWFN